MSEKIKKFWDDAELALIQSWYESEKGFLQLDLENNLKAGTLYEIVNSIPDYRGTRCSIGRWLRRQKKDHSATSNVEKDTPSRKKKTMLEKSSLHKNVTDISKVERQLMRELDEARKKIARLEAQQAKDELRKEFLEGQIEEYKKLVKPSQSKKSHTK